MYLYESLFLKIVVHQ